MYRMQWRDVENCMQVCLASLDDIERQRANGEILGTSLLNQDVLQSGLIQLKSLHGIIIIVAESQNRSSLQKI